MTQLGLIRMLNTFNEQSMKIVMSNNFSKCLLIASPWNSGLEVPCVKGFQERSNNVFYLMFLLEYLFLYSTGFK